MKASRHRSRFALGSVAIGGALSLMLSGCSGNSNSGPGEEVTLTLGIQTETNKNKPYASIIADFEKANPGIKVKVQESPLDSYASSLTTQLQGGSGPDIFYGSPGTGGANSLLTWAESGYLLPITGQEWADKAIPSNAETLFKSNNDTWALPMDLVPIVAVVNQTGYEKQGLTFPTTFKDLVSKCAEVKQAGKSVWVLPAATPPANGLFALEIAAGDVYAEQPDWNDQRKDGKVTFASSPGWKKTLERIREMNDNGCFQNGAAGMTNETSFPLLAQNLGLTAAAPGSAANEFAQLNKELTWTVGAFPAETAESRRIYASPSNALAINAKTSAPDAAKKLLEFFAMPENQNKFAELNGTASLAASQGSDVTGTYAPLKDFLADESKFLPLPNLSWPNGKVYMALGEGVQGLITGQATVDQVLTKMDAEWSN